MTEARQTRRWLTFCHTVELVALTVWVGGLVVIIGAVIPAVFNSFGMEPGGRFLTRVFDGYNRLTGGAVALLVGTSAWRVWNGAQGNPEGALSKPELTLLSAMIVIAFLITLVLGPWSVSLQEQAFAAQGDAKKMAYDSFFRVHTVVRGLYVLNLGLGIGLVAVKVRDWMNR